MSNQRDVLAEIVGYKRAVVEQQALQKPLESFVKRLIPSSRSLKQALSNPQSDFILECKKASPSKGLIRKDFDLDAIINHYKEYASAISVLTDEKYFSGKHEYLQRVSELVDCPVLCKDFFISPYQVYQARLYGADAILLMLSVLDDEDYLQLAKIAAELHLDVLTEVHDQEELERALKLDAAIIGINNRNLKDLSINLATTKNLMKSLSAEEKQQHIFISESGIDDYSQVKSLASMPNAVDGFLVGSSIMSKPDIAAQCKQLLYGRVKICGLTSVESAKIAAQEGATYGGLIFYAKSPRFVSLEQAKAITQAVNLIFVAVFVNHPMEEMFEIIQQLELTHIQLHGDETQETIQRIKQRFPHLIIWQVIKIKSDLSTDIKNIFEHSKADYFLLDKDAGSQIGGAGSSFNWESIHSTLEARSISEKIILAGGINFDNLRQAIQQNAFCIDINSGVESAPGIKDKTKIKQIMQSLRA